MHACSYQQTDRISYYTPFVMGIIMWQLLQNQLIVRDKRITTGGIYS